jgi:signal peptidase I
VKRNRLYSGLATLALLIIAGVAWFYFAPAKIGGSSRYVVTNGVSMEPRFHTGDLAIVRPVSNYRVGEIVAYWSTELHTVVLHRIIAKDGNSYEFKGDNNHFIDPVKPTHSQLLGKLWLHVPRAGRVLEILHTPVAAALLCAVVGLLTLFGVKDSRRRRIRRRKGATGSCRTGIPIVNSPRDHRLFNFGALFVASALAAAVFAVLGLFALSRPATRPSVQRTPYTQQVSFGYSAHVTPGPVYAGRTITTGDPIFTALVHRLRIHIRWSATGLGSNTVKGTEEVVLKLTGPSGWSRTYVLTPATHFTGDHTTTDATLDLGQLQALLTRIATLTGTGGFSSFSIAVGPQVNITGNVAGHPITGKFAPALTFQPQGGQLVVGTGSAASGGNTGAVSSASGGASSSSGSQASITQRQTGSLSSQGTVPATITVLGISAEISVLRWLALVGLCLFGGVAVYAYLRKRSEPFVETRQIQSQYGHMIVPIIGGEDLGWPPVDVPDIKTLVKLAEAGQRLILHNRSNDIDTYMLNEEGTVYRYQVKPSNVVWGEWSETDAPVKAAA